MKTPPFLMAAALLFWGWQSDLLPAAVVMAALLEASRVVKARWDISDTEMIRIYNFCALLGLAAFIYAFAANDGPAKFSKMFDEPDFRSSQDAGNSSTMAAISLIRWLPMVAFLMAAAQAFGSQESCSLEVVSPFLRYRRKHLLKTGRLVLPASRLNFSWPYFVTCGFAAGAHKADPGDLTFFWGLCALLAWALWSQRPPGAARYLWIILLSGVVGAGFFGQRGLGAMNQIVDMANSYNPAWLARFFSQRTDPERAHTAIGHIGMMKESAKIVLRVAPVTGVEVPTYLREASYRFYTAEVWSVGGQPDFLGVPETPPNSGRWQLESVPPGRTNGLLVNISCYLNGRNAKDGNPVGLLPLPTDCDRLEDLPAYSVQNSSGGAVLAEGPGLVMFNAAYGSGATMDAAPGTNDLVLPDKETNALGLIVNQLHADGLSDEKKLIAVAHYFAVNYHYSLWQPGQPAGDTNSTPLADFLLRTHAGHCEYFATATVLLLRELHIPARYAVGYYVHEPSGHHYVVRERDAHAWTLVWNHRTGAWENFDTTPASWIQAEGQRKSPWQFVTDFFSWVQFQFSKFKWGQSHLRPYLLMLMVPVLLYFLYQIIYNRHRHKGQGAGKAAVRINWPGLDSEFYLLEQKLARRGLVRRPGESMADWLQHAAADPAVSSHREPLRQLLRLHYRHRFDPRGLPAKDREQLKQQAKECLDAIP